MSTEVITSKFLRIIKGRGTTVAYHSLYGNPVRIDSDIEQLLHQLTVPRRPEDVAVDGPELLDALEDLIRLGFVVSPSATEYEKWRSSIQDMHAREPPFAGGIVLLVTTACNLSCNYCMASHTLPSNKTMTYSTAETALRTYMTYFDTISTNYNLGEPMIIFTGGEPLLHFELIEHLCEFASKTYPDHQLKFRLITNGTLINSKIAEFLKEYMFDIVVSLDGGKEINDMYRRFSNGEPSSDAVWKGIETLLLYGVDPKTISLSAVYHEDHPHGLDNSFFDLVADHGIKNVNVNLDNTILMRSSPQMMAQKFLSLHSLAQSKGITLSGRWAVPADVLRTRRRDCAVCSGAERSKLFVQPGGELTLCDYHPDVLGRIEHFEQYVESISHSQKCYTFGNWSECRGCEIEGFCSPCILEKEVLHEKSVLFQQQKCEFLKMCTRFLLLE